MADLHLTPAPDPADDELLAHLVRARFLGEQADPGRARAEAAAMLERIAERLTVHDLVEDGGVDGVVGRVWLVERGDDLSVLHVRLAGPDGPDGPSRLDGVRRALEAHARAAGAARLAVEVHPGDPVTEGLVAADGFETAAVQMRLDLTGDLPGEDVVVLEAMDEADYAAWEADEVESYAEARTRSGESPERALEVSREQHAELLPDGLATAHHHFFVGRVGGPGGTVVGSLWIGAERPMAFVYDVVVEESQRRRGYGGGLMRAGALRAREMGAHALGLNVFGYNHGARALYDALGYDVVQSFVGKPL